MPITVWRAASPTCANAPVGQKKLHFPQCRQRLSSVCTWPNRRVCHGPSGRCGSSKSWLSSAVFRGGTRFFKLPTPWVSEPARVLGSLGSSMAFIAVLAAAFRASPKISCRASRRFSGFAPCASLVAVLRVMAPWIFQWSISEHSCCMVDWISCSAFAFGQLAHSPLTRAINVQPCIVACASSASSSCARHSTSMKRASSEELRPACAQQ